jgi:LCP family protein required for cell wall assembly
MRPRNRRSAFRKLFLPLILMVGMLLAYLLFPASTNILVLGLDYAPPGSDLARSDTIILTSLKPHKPAISMLSIPRDLWVDIPGVGENRINTAHFYAESQNPGSGPQAAVEAVEANFDLNVNYYLRLHFDGVREIVNALDGVTLQLSEPASGYPAGSHHLNGNKALAFARDRSGTDDFFRMQHGQLLIKAILRETLDPRNVPKLPQVALALMRSIDTNIPIWLWPRLGLTFLRVGPTGIETHTITREMVTPFTTSLGASVLLPNWEPINALVRELIH